jgi:hypothetical protein
MAEPEPQPKIGGVIDHTPQVIQRCLADHMAGYLPPFWRGFISRELGGFQGMKNVAAGLEDVQGQMVRNAVELCRPWKIQPAGKKSMQ